MYAGINDTQVRSYLFYLLQLTVRIIGLFLFYFLLKFPPWCLFLLPSIPVWADIVVAYLASIGVINISQRLCVFGYSFDSSSQEQNLFDILSFSYVYRVTQKKCNIRILGSNLFQKSDLLFCRCFGTRKSTPFHLATSISPIQNQKYPKNAINACANTQISPQPLN